MADWVGVANTTIRDYIREVENDVMRNRKLLALMQGRGRVTFNHSGTEMQWPILYKRATIVGYADEDTVTFPRRNRWKNAVLPYRGYSLGESLSKLDELKNKGTPAIVKMIETKVERMVEDFEENFGDELYVDGNATGNTRRIHGVESFLGAGTVSTYQPVAFPSDTYAGLSTALAAYGGSWGLNPAGSLTAWPVSKGSVEYDFYSPTLVDYSNSFWGSPASGETSWDSFCTKAMRYGIIRSMKSKSEKGRINMILLEGEMYRKFAQKVSEKERIMVMRKDGDSQTLVGLGFGDVINFEGCEVTWEYGMTLDTGYGFNVEQMELRSMQAQLFMSEGPFRNEESKTTRWSVDMFGNLVFQPRYFVKFKNYT
jgi:hypothetical protein